MPFRFRGLPLAHFSPLFGLSDQALAAKGAVRVVADVKPGFPCRITLEDAEPGESLILASYAHQPVPSPYRSSGPVFVRESARETYDRIGEVPRVLRNRTLSLRVYDEAWMMIDADIVDGNAIEFSLERFFADRNTAYLHIHNAKRGCFACCVERA